MSACRSSWTAWGRERGLLWEAEERALAATGQ